jgi:hypothetical protein
MRQALIVPPGLEALLNAQMVKALAAEGTSGRRQKKGLREVLGRLGGYMGLAL